MLYQSVDDALVVGCCPSGVTHHHRFGLTIYLVDGVVHEVIQNDGSLAQHDIAVLAQVLVDEFKGFLLGEELILVLFLVLFYKFYHGLVALVVEQHVENEALVDGLLHGVEVEGLAVTSEDGIGLVFWRCRESEVRQVVHLLARALHVGHDGIHV